MNIYPKKIIGLGMILFTVILLQNQTSFSQEEENPYENQCGQDQCCSSYHRAVDAAEDDWEENLSQLMDQEKPASAMVSEGFESLRTLDCWMEYTCKAVLYSAITSPDNVEGTGILEKHIGKIPTCQAPENLTFQTGWNAFVDYIKTGDPFLDELIKPNQLNFIPACMSNVPNNQNPDFDLAQHWYQGCLNLIEEKMGCDTASSECSGNSSLFVKLETALRGAHSQQQTRALESKLFDIVNGLSAMQGVANGVEEDLRKLDSLYACRPGKCD